MKDNEVFFTPTELARLEQQKQLFSPCEQPIYEALLCKKEMCILDIGANNGVKTKERFDLPNVKQVIGLEYHKDLAEYAQKRYGNEKFFFDACNVDCAEFEKFLTDLMQRKGIEGFDVIHLSLVLSHLQEPKRLLQKLHRFLTQDGLLLILEGDDGACSLVPDENGRFAAFLSYLSCDVFAGDRTLVTKLQPMLSDLGYKVEVFSPQIIAQETQWQRKEAIYQVFFSYLLPDIKVLREQEPFNLAYATCETWLEENLEDLRCAICEKPTKSTVGLRFFVARKG